MLLLLLHPGDLSYSQMISLLLVVGLILLAVGVGFGVLLSLLLKKFLKRGESRRSNPETHPHE